MTAIKYCFSFQGWPSKKIGDQCAEVATGRNGSTIFSNYSQSCKVIPASEYWTPVFLSMYQQRDETEKNVCLSPQKWVSRRPFTLRNLFHWPDRCPGLGLMLPMEVLSTPPKMTSRLFRYVVRWMHGPLTPHCCNNGFAISQLSLSSGFPSLCRHTWSFA